MKIPDMKSAALKAGYWLVAGIPYFTARTYRGLLRQKTPKGMAAFQRIPLMLLALLQVGGYVLWAMDYFRFFHGLSHRARVPFDDPKLGLFNPAVWRHLYKGCDRGLHLLLWTPTYGPLSLFWVWFLLFGPVCLALTLWFLYYDQEFDPEKIGRLKVSPQRVKIIAEKAAKTTNGVFLGASKSAHDKPVVLPDSWRTSHTYCVGASRSGKTVSVMLPMALQDIERGNPVIFFDGKGDCETLNAITAKAQEYGRLDSFQLFSLSEPCRSKTYNPLSFGNATQKKDKLIGAFTWTEEHYKKACEETLLTVIQALEGTGEYYNLEDLYLCLTELKAVRRVYDLCKNQAAKEHLEHFFENFASITKDISGLTKDLGLIVKNDFWFLMDTYCPEIDFFEVINKRKILYLVLNTQAYQDTAERLAKLFLQDLRATSDIIQNKVPRNERVFTPIYVDEFNSFAFDAFGDFMSKCGGAGFALTLAHQSLGQLAKRGEYFKDEILDNANIKIIMRQDSPKSVEEFAKTFGTHVRTEYTEQIEDGLFFDKQGTGLGSARRVEAFNINPNRIKQLQPHEAAVLIKQPFQYDIVQLDVRTGRSDSYDYGSRTTIRNYPLPRGKGINLRGYMREVKGKK